MKLGRKKWKGLERKRKRKRKSGSASKRETAGRLKESPLLMIKARSIAVHVYILLVFVHSIVQNVHLKSQLVFFL